MTYRTLLLSGLVAGVLAGATFHLAQPERYTSTAHMVIVATPVNSVEEDEASVSIDSAIQLLRSQQVLGQAARDIDYPGGRVSLNADLATRPIINSRIVRVSVSALDPDTAREAVAAVTERFYMVRTAALRRTARAESERVSAAIDVVEAQLAQGYGLTPAAAAGEAESDQTLEDGAAPDVGPLVQLRAELHGEQSALAISEPEPGYLSRPPTLPTQGVRSGFAITMSSAATLGLVVAAAVGALHHLRSRERQQERRDLTPTPRSSHGWLRAVP